MDNKPRELVQQSADTKSNQGDDSGGGAMQRQETHMKSARIWEQLAKTCSGGKSTSAAMTPQRLSDNPGTTNRR
jgi:hypothetical protein